MIRKMYCIEADKNSLYVDKDVYDYIVSLEQQCKKQKEVIDNIKLIVKGIAYGGNENYYMEKISKINELLNEVSK